MVLDTVFCNTNDVTKNHRLAKNLIFGFQNFAKIFSHTRAIMRYDYSRLFGGVETGSMNVQHVQGV